MTEVKLIKMTAILKKLHNEKVTLEDIKTVKSLLLDLKLNPFKIINEIKNIILYKNSQIFCSSNVFLEISNQSKIEILNEFLQILILIKFNVDKKIINNLLKFYIKINKALFYKYLENIKFNINKDTIEIIKKILPLAKSEENKNFLAFYDIYKNLYNLPQYPSSDINFNKISNSNFDELFELLTLAEKKGLLNIITQQIKLQINNNKRSFFEEYLKITKINDQNKLKNSNFNKFYLDKLNLIKSDINNLKNLIENLLKITNNDKCLSNLKKNNIKNLLDQKLNLNEVSNKVNLIDPKINKTQSQPDACSSLETHILQKETPIKQVKTGRFSKKNRNKTVLPDKFKNSSYSGLKWKKMPKSDKAIFSSIDLNSFDYNLEDFNLFLNKEIEVKKKIEFLQKEEEIFLDSKKNYNISIALSRVKIKNEELFKKIIDLDFDNENVINQFLKYYPSAEEFNLIKNNKEKLNKVETFFYLFEDKDIEIFYEKCLLLKFINLIKNFNFDEFISENIKKLDLILNSKDFKDLIGNLFLIGNVLNNKTFLGNAEAFDLIELDAFKTKQIKILIKNRVNLKSLEKIFEMKFNDLTLIKENIKDLKTTYKENSMDKKYENKYKKILFNFDELNKNVNKMKTYLNLEEDKISIFQDKIYEMIKYFIK